MRDSGLNVIIGELKGTNNFTWRSSTASSR